MKLNQAKLAFTIVLGATMFSLQAMHGAPARAQNAPSISIRDVQTVFHRQARGSQYFTARVRAELVQDGLRFVNNPRQADAILDTVGDYNGAAFLGKLTFTDQSGRVIWAQNFYRPDNARTYVYNQRRRR